MSRITARFDTLGRQARKALIPYITAGDPEPSVTVALMHAMVEAGADIIELGIPFSDPMADGPVIQAAYERALKHHVNLHRVLDMVDSFRAEDTDTPVVLMGYLNPVEVMGYGEFAKAAAASGVDGALTVDLPPEEAHELLQALRPAGIDPIFLIAPTSPVARIKAICAAARGFVYYVSFKGVTGANKLDVGAVATKLTEVREHAQLPIGVGFGIKDAASAARVAQIADAVVVGSAVVKRIEDHAGNIEAMRTEVSSLLKAMREAMDAAIQDERVA